MKELPRKKWLLPCYPLCTLLRFAWQWLSVFIRNGRTRAAWISSASFTSGKRSIKPIRNVGSGHLLSTASGMILFSFLIFSKSFLLFVPTNTAKQLQHRACKQFNLKVPTARFLQPIRHQIHSFLKVTAQTRNALPFLQRREIQSLIPG